MAKRFIGDSNSSNRLKGVTDGVAIPAGYVGEIQEVTSTTGTILSTTAGTLTDVGLSLTLTAGIWDIEAYICIGYVVTAGTGNVGRNGFIAITDNSNNDYRTINENDIENCKKLTKNIQNKKITLNLLKEMAYDYDNIIGKVFKDSKIVV